MNYNPENGIPSLFTDFDDIKDFPWLFPDLQKFVFPWFFPDHGNSAVTSQQISPLPQIIEYRETSGWFEFKCGQPQDITGLLFLQSGVVEWFCWGTCKLQLSCQCTVIKVFLECYSLLAFCLTVCVRYPSLPKYEIHYVSIVSSTRFLKSMSQHSVQVGGCSGLTRHITLTRCSACTVQSTSLIGMHHMCSCIIDAKLTMRIVIIPLHELHAQHYFPRFLWRPSFPVTL